MNRLHFACEAVVCDIEGTTGSTAFVNEILFPYAQAHLEEFVRAHRTEPVTAAVLDQTAKIAALARDNEDALVDTLRSWMAQDRKETPLKTLQGEIWVAGYADGSLRGHVYSDAVDALRAWHARGIKLFVYSSGSIAAQQLLFSHSVAGDLTPIFSGYFDTTTGPKREASSYTAIARSVGMHPGRILFLSDTPQELDAARTAGFRTVQVVRANDATEAQASHVSVGSFEELMLEPAYTNSPG
ncbi:MAG: acireductone synthase [Candidatus Eremiobacteraeota bacterium]|nr:acireductone synthase [Candidatus Eremiobacteraeota bacterium]